MNNTELKKKIFAGLLAGGMVLSTIAPVAVHAAPYAYTGLAGTSITFPNTIAIESGATVPAVASVPYTVASVSNPNNGATGAPTIAPVSFTAGQATNTVNSTIDFSGVTFSRPGEYVWSVTPGAISSAAGVTRTDTEPKYLHVFITDNNGTLEQSAAYLSAESTAGDETEKAAGFDLGFDTVELEVSKTVTGNAGDKSEVFQIQVDLTGCNPGSVLDGVTVANDGTWTKTYSLTHGESATITGIPKGAGYTATELAATDYTTTIERTTTGSGN